MRLDFNIAFIDDEIGTMDSDTVDELIENVEDYIGGKGFNPISTKYTNSNDCIEANAKNRRIDLYISDNNLHSEDSGIELYLTLKNNFICDFILYTRSEKKEIINSLIDHLKHKADPNIFTRFTFITRDSSDEWHNAIFEVIDHILTKREELNNLRGLYAQVTAKIHNKLREALDDDEISFKKAIELAFEDKIISNDCDPDFKKHLLFHLDTRNGLIHHDEERDISTGKYKISYYVGKTRNSKGSLKIIHEDDFSMLRKNLMSIKERFFKQLP